VGYYRRLGICPQRVRRYDRTSPLRHSTRTSLRRQALSPTFIYGAMLSRYSSGIARSNNWTCLSCTALARTSQALIAGPPKGPSAHIHQRKHSSSKASSSAKDDPRAITTPSEAPAKDAKTPVKEGAEKRTGSRPSKRKTKDPISEAVAKTAPESSLNLPSVPSTNHIHHIGKPCTRGSR
jgi:hypothetical protein